MNDPKPTEPPTFWTPKEELDIFDEEDITNRICPVLPGGLFHPEPLPTDPK